MRRLSLPIGTLVVLSIVAFGTRVSDASVASDVLFRDGSITQLAVDDNYEGLARWDAVANEYVGLTAADSIQQGDILFGMQVITQIYASADSSRGLDFVDKKTFTTLFVAEVAGTVLADSNWVDLTPVDSALFGAFTGFTPTGTGTILAVFSKQFTSQPYDAITPYHAGGTSAALATAITPDLEWEFGFTGTGGVAQFGESAQFRTDELIVGNITTADDIAFEMALNVTKWGVGAPLGLVNELDGRSPTHIHMQGEVISQYTDTPKNFALITQSSAWLNAVPEPSTVAMLIGLATMGAGGLIRRRRSK